MPTILSQLETLRETVADRLRGLADFQVIKVVTRQDGDIVRTIEDAVARVGMSIEVYIKSARPTQSQSYTVKFDPVVIGVAFYENVLVNQDPTTGTGLGAYFWVEAVLVALKMWTPPGLGSVLMPDPEGPRPAVSEKMPTALILTLDFSTVLQLAARQS